MVNYVQPAGSAFEPWGVEQQLVKDIDSAESPSAMRMLMGYAAQRMGANIDQQRAQQQVLGLQQQQSAVEQRQHNVKSLIDIMGAITKNPGAASAFQGGVTAPLLQGVDLNSAVNTATQNQGFEQLAHAGTARNAGYGIAGPDISRITGLPVTIGPTAGERSAAASGSGAEKGDTVSWKLAPANGGDFTSTEQVLGATSTGRKRPGETDEQFFARRGIKAYGGGVPSVTAPAPGQSSTATATPNNAATPPPTQANGMATTADHGLAIQHLNRLRTLNRAAYDDIIQGQTNAAPTTRREGGKLIMYGASGKPYPVP